MCQCLGERKFSTPLGKYQGLWPLDHMVRVCQVLKEATKLSSKVAVLLCTPTSNEWEVIILKHYFWGIHCKTLSNPRIEKSPFTRHNGSSILFKPMLSPLTHGVRSGALEFPHSEREAAWRARLCDHPWSELRTGVQKYRGIQHN